MLGPTPNVYIVKAVTWSKEHNVEVYVHNQLLPESSIVFLPQADVSMGSIPALSDYLVRVSTILSMATICEGITDYENLWNEDKIQSKGV